MKKILKCIICVFIMMFSFVLCSCDLTPEQTPPLPPEQPSVQEVEFNSLLARVSELELLSQNYNSEGATLRALIYIRSGKYNTSQWGVLGGAVDSAFDSYVSANQVKDISGLKNYDTFVVPATSQSVDFVHMIATINGVYLHSNDGQGDLAGWGGDLCQLACEVKTSGKSGNELTQLIATTFNSAVGGFNSADVCADLDAVNIAKLLNQNQNKIAKTMENYYKDLTISTKKSSFIQNIFGTEITSLSQLKTSMYSRVIDNYFLNAWSYQNGINFSNDNDSSIIQQCCDVFAEYLWNN